MNFTVKLRLALLSLLMLESTSGKYAFAAATLNEKCIVNILNRTIQASNDGGWALPNVPSNMGRVRARATCTLENGTTISGQSDYFTLTNNAITNVGDIKFEGQEPIPSEINFAPTSLVKLDGIGKTNQVKAVAKFADSTEKDITASSTGITYTSTNSAIASVSAEGVISARGNGNALINASKDGVMASLRVSVVTSGDTDNDGLPDDWETANGLNPADPVDAQEDKDKDGLSTLDEFNAGTNPSVADTDADGLDDYKEIKQTNTSPILADTDGDGLNDNVELLTNTDPLKSSSANYAAAVQSISVTPPTLVLTFSGVDTEVSTQLKVTGKLVDGSNLDLTSKSRGTTYTSNNLAVVNFGTEDGKVFGGQSGNAIVTIANGTLSIPLAITVESFAPSALSAIDIPGYANNVDVVGDLAFIAAGSAGLQLVDVSNRKTPKIIGKLDTDGNAIDLRVRGNLVFIADGEMGLKIIDVTVPQEPKLIAQLDTAGITQDIQIYGNYAYLANGDAGIEIIDISDATAPTSVGSLSTLGTVKGVDVEGNILTVVAGSSLVTIDVEDKRSPVKVGSINLGAVQDLDVNAGFAHVAAYSNGYRVVDIRDPANLKVTGGDAVIAPRDVELTNGLAFYAEQLFPNVVAYINIEDPSEPVFQGTINLSSFGDYAGTGIALDASYAYITEESYFVSQDFGTTGNTRLFIAQYRMLNDVAGIAPTTSLVYPSQGQIIVENKSVLVSAAAQDDVAVKNVEFWVDDLLVATDTTPPFEIPYTIPAGKRFINFVVTASDLGGNKSSSQPVRVNIQPDKDKDDLGNDEEVETYGTDPNLADTDLDNLPDGREIALNTDPLRKDSDADGINDGAEVLQGTDPLNPDVTAPQVESTNPIANATEVPENQGIVVKFNEALSTKSIKQGVFSLKQQNSLAVDGNLKLLNDREVLFTPLTILNDYTKYNVRIADIRDKAGNPLATPVEFEYTTGNTIDTVAPRVSAITPKNGGNDVPVNSKLTLIMSEPIDATTINEAKFYVQDAVNGARILGNFTVAEDKTTVSFAPIRAFLVGRQHQVYVSGVKDIFGNEMAASYYYFTTAFEADGAAPKIKSTSVNNGQTDVPLNAEFNIQFDEAINGLSLKAIALYNAGVEVPSERKIDTDNKVLSLKPIAPLQAGSSYQLNIGPVEDLSGNILEQESVISFTSGAASDTNKPTITGITPAANSTNVPLNAEIKFTLSEIIDPTTIEDNTFFLQDITENRRVPGAVELAADKKSLTFVPAEPLKPTHQYYVYASYYANLLDLGGNPVGASITVFTTGSHGDTAAPSITESSFIADATNIPVNPQISLTFDKALNPLCINTNTVKLVLKADGSVIAGTVKLATNGRSIDFDPAALLSASTAYELVAEGVCSLNSVKLPKTLLGFTTSATATADSVAPTVTSTIPASGGTAIAIDSSIVVNLNEAIDPTRLNQLQVAATGIGGQIAGSWTLVGNQLTFKPLGNLPSSTTIYAYLYGLTDLAGNVRNSSLTFTTTTGTDTTAPQIELVSPANGAMDIGPNNPIEITFSESMRDNTLTNSNILLYIDGEVVKPSLARSADNRTLTVTSTLPSAKLITVVVTSDVKDLAGNALADFASTFSTAVINSDVGRPSIVRQTPVSGATKLRNLSRISLYASEQLNAASLNQGIYIAADGVLVAGTAALDSSQQVITFTADAPLPDNALIEIYATDKIRDTSGNALNNYHTSFRTGKTSGSTAGVKPAVESIYPSYGQTNVAINPIIELAFTEKLNPAAVSSDIIQLRKTNYTGAIQASTLELSSDGLRVRIKPSAPLEVGTQYWVNISNELTDIDGDKAATVYNYYFSTGATAVEDTQSPLILLTNPTDGAQNVPLNPLFHVRFDEPVHPSSVLAAGNDQVKFSTDNQELWYFKDTPLKANTDTTETFTGILDTSGNAIADKQIKFKTAERVDVTPPALQSITPANGATNVPVNAIVRVSFNEPLNPLTVTQTGVYLYDTALGTKVTATMTLEPGGRDISLVASAPLTASRTYYVYTYNVQDLANNVYSNAYSFTTGAETDTVAPAVLSSSVDEGQIGIPLNARLRVRFNEPINIQKMDGFSLSTNSIAVPANKSLSDDRLVLTLSPKQLLIANTAYELTIAKAEDLSGNVLAEPLVRQFTTATKADAQNGTITASAPLANSTNVSLNPEIKITLSEVIDPTSLQDNTYFLQDLTENRRVAGRMELSIDKKIVTFTPTDPLKAAHQYYIYAGYYSNLFDLGGNPIGASVTAFSTGNQ